MQRIINNVLEREMRYDETIVLKYHIEYPTIVSNSYIPGVKSFNEYNENLAFRLKKRSESQLYNEAVELYKYNKSNGYPNMIYEIYRNYEITLNADNIISLYIDEYIFSGGAHGNTVRTSQNWELYYNQIIHLEDIYKYNPYFVINILKSINNQISQEKEIYFEDSCILVLNTFNPRNFYLIPGAVVIYFQQYDIAPYSSGIRTFIIL